MKRAKTSPQARTVPKGPALAGRDMIRPMLLAACLAWACLVGIPAVRAWPDAAPALKGLIAIWAQLPAWSWAGAFLRLGSYAGCALLTLVILAAALGAGSTVTALLARTRRGGRSLSLGLTIALGFGLLSVVVTGLGLAGLMGSPMLQLLAAGAIVSGVLAGGARRGELAMGWQDFRRQPAATAGIIILCSLLWIALSALPDTLEDPLVYHWAAPEHFLRLHRLVGAPQHVQWHNPLGVEMIYALALALGGVAAVKAADLAMLAGALLAIASLTRRLEPRAGGWAAIALIALSPAITEQIWIAKNDIGLITFWTAALLVPFEIPLRSLPGAVTAGILVGLCGTVKYTAAFPMLGLLAWLLVRRPGLRGAAIIAATATAVAAAWPLRNWIETGNPLFAYGSRFLGGLWWGPEYEKAVHTYIRSVTPGYVREQSYWLVVWRDVLGEPNALGLALAALAPLGLAALLPPSAGLACAVSVVVFLALLAERNARFLLPLAALAAAGGEVAIVAMRAAWPRVARGVWITLLTLSAFHLADRTALFMPAHDWCWLAGQMTARELVTERYTCLEELRDWTAKNLPADARILLTGDHKRFGFRQPVVSTNVVVMPIPWRLAKESRNATDLAKKWKQAGYRYVAHNLVSGRFRHQLWFQGPPWDDRALQVYRAFAVRYLREVHRSPHIDYVNGMYYVLRVDRRPNPPAASVPVLPWTEAIFAPPNAAPKTPGNAATRTLTLAALARLPDVEDAIEEAAMNLHAINDGGNSVKLNRLLAGAGFEGEAGWFNLSDEESRIGNRKAAFSALRHEFMFAPSFRDKAAELQAVLYYNWMVAKAKEGDLAGCCRLLDMCLHAVPTYQPAISATDQLGCINGRPGRQIGKFLFSK